jgi:hypothetical protein
VGCEHADHHDHDHAGFARVLQKYRLAKYDPAAVAAAAAVDSASADDAGELHVRGF